MLALLLLLPTCLEVVVDFGCEWVGETGLARPPTDFKRAGKVGVITPLLHFFDNIDFFHVDALDLRDVFHFVVTVLRKRFVLLFDQNRDVGVGDSVDLSGLYSISNSIIDDIDWDGG